METMSMAEHLFFAVILERTDGTSGAIESPCKNKLTFKKNLIFCYEILSLR